MRKPCVLLLLLLIVSLGVLPACSSPAPMPPTITLVPADLDLPTAVPATAAPPTEAPIIEVLPTAAIVDSLPTLNPEPTEPVRSFLPDVRSEITKNNVKTLTRFGELPGTAAAHLAISPDNHWLVSFRLGNWGDINVWNLWTGKLEKVLNGAWDDRITVDDVFFLPDGVLVAHLNPVGGGNTWRTEGRAQHWDIETGEIIKELKCYHIVYSRDGSLYAFLPEFDEKDMTAIVVDAATDQIIQVITPGARIYAPVFTPDNQILVGVTGDAWQKEYSFWDIEDGSRNSVLYDATCLSFSEGSTFAVLLDNQDSDELGELVLLDLGNFEKRTITRQADMGWGCPPVITHSTDMVIFSAYNEVLFYDALDVDILWATIGKYPSEPKIHLSTDHTVLAVVGYDYNIQLFSVP